MSERDFFIGWDKPAPATRRAFLGWAVSGALASGGLAAAFGARSVPAGDGAWDQAAVQTFEGVATAEPYPMLRTLAPDGEVRILLLGSQGKCGVATRIAALEGQRVRLRGSLVQRGRRGLIALANEDWMTPLGGRADPRLLNPPLRLLGSAALRGEILDAKCWLGAMRPGHGKPHKACARLCIRSGVPPAFFPFKRQDKAQPPLLLVSSQDRSAKDIVLPLVGDPVLARGDILMLGDFPMFRLAGVQSLRSA